jgi:hypothetical protein
VAVLGDDRERSESCGGPQDRADIVRVGDLIEHQKDRTIGCGSKNVVEPDFLEWLGLHDHALVRRIARHKPPEIGDVRISDRNIAGEAHGFCRFACRPGADDGPLWIVESSGNRVAPPKTWALRRCVLVVRALSGHRRRSWGRPPCQASP